jgi:hypothetical protein
MHIATMGLKALVDLEHTFCTIGKCEPGGTQEVLKEALWEQCQHTMGMPWCKDFRTASEAAAMIIALALLKQIEIVED